MADIQRVISGRGKLVKLPELMEKLNIQRPLLIGMEPLMSTLLKKVPQLLTAPVFSGFHANPDLQDTEAGCALYRKEQCDGLISIGGGSSIDTGKGIKARLSVGSMEEAAGQQFPEHMPIPHIAIPGTAGTGSEATQFAVQYQEGKKLSLNHPDLRPEGVLLDAELLDSLPPYHRKSCALDALSQGIESYWCNAATDDSKVHAYLAVTGVLDNLKAYLVGDPHAAEEMLDASYQSGKAIQLTRTTAAHAMSYQLTKKMGLAHGHACLVTLPVLWEMMMDHKEQKEKLKELSSIMRLGDPLIVPRLLRGILYALEMPIPENPGEEVLDELTDSVNAERLNNHPVRMSREDVKEAYRRAFTPLCENERQACLDIWEYYGR